MSNTSQPELYISEKSVVNLFYDFYTTNYLWYWTIGINESKIGRTVILPWKKEVAIQQHFEDVVGRLKRHIIANLEKSIRLEARHFYQCGPGLYSLRYLKESLEECEKEGDDGESLLQIYTWLKKHGQRNVSKKSLEIIRECFTLEGWDDQYGGTRWEIATDWLIKLKNSTSITNDVFIIDQIFDLQHNSGFILDKTNFYILGEENDSNDYVSHLDTRSIAPLDVLLSRSTKRTQHLVIANRNFLPKIAV